jgi:hypothetical protein
MDVPLLLTADYASVSEHGKINVMGIFGQIWAASFPAAHPEMYLVAILTPSPAEYRSTRKITIKLLNEDATQELASVSHEVTISPPKQAGQRVDVPIILRLVTLVFPQPGTYQFSVLVDQDEKRSLPLVVSQGPAPEGG